MIFKKFTGQLPLALFLIIQIGCTATPTETVMPPLTVTPVISDPVATEPAPVEIEPPLSPTPIKTLSTITYNEIKEGHLDDATLFEEWIFVAQAGERINLVVNAQFDSYLELFSPDGQLMISNDDSGDSLNAALFDVQIAQSGQHTIRVRGYNAAIGGYALALTGGHPTTGGGTLTDDQPRTVILSASGLKWHYEGQQGTYLTITSVAEAGLDSYLSLYGPDGTLLIEDDDSGSDLNAEIFEFQLLETGRYTLYAGLINKAGLVTITVNSEAQPAGGGELTLGQSHDGMLRSGRVHRWHFTGQAGQVINLNLNSTEFDTFLELRDSQDVILAENDDYEGGTNSTIDRFILPADDTYTVIARGLSDNDSGNYEINLKPIKISGGGGPLSPDQSTEVTLQANQIDTWLIEVEADTFITIRTQSGQLDTYLGLIDPDGELLAEDDDSGGGLNAALIDFPIQKSGQHQIIVRAAQTENEQLGDTQSGVYQILFTATEILEATGQLTPAQPQEASLAQGEQHTWTFAGQAGETITIEMASATLDTYLSLYNNEGTLLAVNDDFIDKQAAITNFIIPADGSFRVLARAYSGEEVGEYTISLQVEAESPSTE